MANIRHERFNAKARQSTAGDSSKKKGKGKSRSGAYVEPQQTDFDPNAAILAPKTKEEKELDRKEKMRLELAAQSQSKMTSKKKRRLDKYIEKKLKKDERVVLFQKLTETQAQLPSSLRLQASSTLGTGRATTHEERLARAEDKEVRRAMSGMAGSGKGKRKRARRDAVFESGESDEEDEMKGEKQGMEVDEDVPTGEGRSKHDPIVVVDTTISALEPKSDHANGASLSAVGSGLKRNTDGRVVVPRVVKRVPKGKVTAFQSWKHNTKVSTPATQSDASDTSFDSSDSANDSDSHSSSGAEEDYEANDSSSEDEDDSSQDEADEQDESGARKRKRGGFKDWALRQVAIAKGYEPTSIVNPSATLMATDLSTNKTSTGPRAMSDAASFPIEMRGPLGEDLNLPSTSLSEHLRSQSQTQSKGIPSHKPTPITRLPEIQEARLLLPIVAEEQPIVEAVLLNTVIIICGETGSGKTTQVPQFLYEAGFGVPESDNPGMIGITQPRRVAAQAMAARVAHELSLPSSRVSYQIRYDASVSPSTSIKFMTDGVLLRELAADFLLSRYSVIIIDEAHERSVNTDILIGVLSRVIRLREEMWKQGKDGVKPLRLIIMSATLRVSDFAENKTLFPSPPPVITVAARQHPVTVHFNRRTTQDYVTEAVRKATKIHLRLPPGGILIFLTGQNEIAGVCRKLEMRFGRKTLEERRKRRAGGRGSKTVAEDLTVESNVNVASTQADVEAEDLELGHQEQGDLAFDVDADEVDAEALDSDEEKTVNDELGIDIDESDVPMHIMPLYSLLPSEKQMQVFQPPPAGTRLVVVATNVAETSLTIPGIRYVVDCGRAKERRYDVGSGVQSFQVNWISKASAAQRAGRAGRTGPGHCYRLYSSALFEHHFDAFSRPEILRMPIEGVVLQMKSIHIDAVVNFPFPTPPDRLALQKAETVLTYLGALLPALPTLLTEVGSAGAQITDLGRSMALFPLSPRFSRMLVGGRQHGCLPYVIVIVSALSVGDPFLREEAIENDDQQHSGSNSETNPELDHIHSEVIKKKEIRKIRRRAFFQSQQMHSALGRGTSDVFRVLSVVGAYEYAGGGQQFCTEQFVRPKAMEEIHKLRSQINNIVQTNFPGMDLKFVSDLGPPTELQLKVLRQLLAAGFIDQVAIRKDLIHRDASAGIQYANSRGVPYQALGLEEDVFIHPSSVLATVSPPDFVVYHEIVRTTRLWMRTVTTVNPNWLATLGKPSLCTFSKPTKNSDGDMIVTPRFGPASWELPSVKVVV